MCPDFSFLPTEKDGFTHCFVCGQDNPIGLKLKFTKEGRTVKTEFIPGELYQGWPGLIHGAIIIALLDEAMSYACYYNGYDSVTGKLSTKLKKPAKIAEPLIVTGNITRISKKLIETRATVALKNGETVAGGVGTMFIL
ncbi:MAG: PaaI family thioesterase, partial [Dehalococcoidia bacterium]|nr:PaaI family thioesterase [Dehalococcoidia bacterium]